MTELVAVASVAGMSNNTLPERLLNWREGNKLSQEEAAELIGASARQYHRWETGQAVPYKYNLKRIAATLKIDFEELLDRDPSKPTTNERLTALETKLDEALNRLEEVLNRLC